MIKIGIRKNLFYPMMLIILNTMRQIDSIIISSLLKLDSSLIMTLLMFLGEFFAGIIFYLYEFKYLPKRKTVKFMGIVLVKSSARLKQIDSGIKIFFLILMATFFDFVEYVISTFYLSQFHDFSVSLKLRLSGILTIISALICYYLLKLRIYRHQKLSLIVRLMI